MKDTHTSRSALIVLSGGMDSVTMLYEYQAEFALAVSFDYGSKHNARELSFAALHCTRLDIKHLVIPLGFIQAYFRSGLLIGGCEIQDGAYDECNMATTVVPFRNGIMLSIAAGIAESNDLNRIYIANHFGDHAIYPDCRAAFIRPMTEAVREGTACGIKLQAPYTDLSKAQIARIGYDLGLDYAETWSCYRGGEFHCGQCSTCVERHQACLSAGFEDPTIYTP